VSRSHQASYRRFDAAYSALRTATFSTAER
jgi:hypothetical protein